MSQLLKDCDRLPQSYTGIAQKINNLGKSRLWKRRD